MAFIAPPSCYVPARQAWGASHPSIVVETSAPEPCRLVAPLACGRFSLQPGKWAISKGVDAGIRKNPVTRRNENLPNQIFPSADCKLTLASFLRKGLVSFLFFIKKFAAKKWNK
ncbi:MAG: hypothetical protein ABIO21_01955 [Pseudomonas sp.]